MTAPFQCEILKTAPTSFQRCRVLYWGDRFKFCVSTKNRCNARVGRQWFLPLLYRKLRKIKKCDIIEED